MKKPKRPLNDGFDANAGDMWDKWEAYHNWYIKTHCVRKKDLPTVEEIKEFLRELLHNWHMSEE